MSKTDTGSATALTADVVMKEARERVYRDSDDDATGNVVGFAEWICDRLPLSSVAPSESRAGALTAEQFERIACSAASDAGRIPGANLYNAAKFACDEIRQLLAASPVEQHEAAPADDARECLMDVVSHHANIVSGFAAQRKAAEDANDGDDALFWKREIEVAHRMKAQAERALAVMSQPEPPAANERAAFDAYIAEPTKGGRSRFDDFQAGVRYARTSSPIAAGAQIGWVWISPTGHVSRFTVDFDGKHDQLAHGWKVRPVAFCDSATNEAGATVAWMHVDDPRECVSDAKKRDMIEHAGAPGARLAAKFSIALGKLPSA
ncbi:hypothetical protein [Burkholderia vietnamiensis]|uniref:hypothetical protein n=1 Tax=Burkholderia vietnamiensis TaxID=60552 RepID=UPI001CAB597B|nr:hypothetical protein [Burkholderia vietnamiensis]CAG9229371.1 hypothetical protein BVI1335_70199 [Burkholderia vietnamiensis]